jgi:hypothetical protein
VAEDGEKKKKAKKDKKRAAEDDAAPASEGAPTHGPSCRCRCPYLLPPLPCSIAICLGSRKHN